MQDHDFEKQVHEKMEGLRVSPSESVWEKVERRVREESKRPNPLLWLFMALGVAFLGSLMMTGLNPVKEVRTPAYSSAKTNSNRSAAEKAGTEPTLSVDKHVAARMGGRLASGRSASDRPGQDGQSVLRRGRNDSNMDHATGSNMEQQLKQPVLKSISEEQESVSNGVQRKPVGNFQVVRVATKSAADFQLQTAGESSSLSLAQGLSSGKKPGSSKRSSAKRRWYWGGQGAAGISTTYQDFFKNAAAGPVAYYSNPSTSPAPVTYNVPSETNPGFSFNAGVFAERVLSPAFSLTGGLNYHYYSDRIHTGGYVASAAVVYTGTTSTVANGYYQSGSSSTYTNQYHFLEVPLRVSYQINQQNKVLFFTEAGCSLGWLMNSNALHFDYASGTYFKDNHLLNKTQVNASLAFEAGFYHRHALVKLGPEVHYGLTNLLTSASGQKQHLFFGGIKLVYIPAKK